MVTSAMASVRRVYDMARDYGPESKAVKTGAAANGLAAPDKRRARLYSSRFTPTTGGAMGSGSRTANKQAYPQALESAEARLIALRRSAAAHHGGSASVDKVST